MLTSPEYQERLVEHLAQTAFWAFNKSDATYDELSAFVKDSTATGNVNDDLVKAVYSRYQELVDQAAQKLGEKS